MKNSSSLIVDVDVVDPVLYTDLVKVEAAEVDRKTENDAEEDVKKLEYRKIENEAEEEVKKLECFPPGYRFAPRDDELIEHYLVNKISNVGLPNNKMHDVDLYRYNPRDLAETYEFYMNRERQKEWYFFTPRDRRYPKGSRPKRAAGDGYWKATGGEKDITNKTKANGKIGQVRTLVFYQGKPSKGSKTEWMMHEYTIDGESPRQRMGLHDMRLDEWVLCRIYQKKTDCANHTNHESGEALEILRTNKKSRKELKLPRTNKNSDKALKLPRTNKKSGKAVNIPTEEDVCHSNAMRTPESIDKETLYSSGSDKSIQDKETPYSSGSDKSIQDKETPYSSGSDKSIFPDEERDQIMAICQGMNNDPESHYSHYFTEDPFDSICGAFCQFSG